MTEAAFDSVANVVATVIEAVMILVVILGTIEALVGALQGAARRDLRPVLRETWLRYAAWIVLSLEFALAADIIRTVVTPSWDEIGKLATIGAIRIALNYFLARDIAEVRRAET